MSKSDAVVGSAAYSVARQGWSDAGLSPLWESAVAHKPDAEEFMARHWRWSDLQKPINEAMTLVSPENVERRVLLFADPTLSTPGRPTSSRTMNAESKCSTKSSRVWRMWQVSNRLRAWKVAR